MSDYEYLPARYAEESYDTFYYKKCAAGHDYPSNGLFDGVCGKCEAAESDSDFYSYAGSDSIYWDLGFPTTDELADHADDERHSAQGE